MYIVQGNKTLEITRSELDDVLLEYSSVHIDLGTGDGRYVYKEALENPGTFYIGVDPSQKQLEIYSKKAVKNKVKNVLFVVGSLEVFPADLLNIAHTATVILPWGSLLSAVVDAEAGGLNTIHSLLHEAGLLTVVFGYSAESEPTEVKRLELENIDIDMVNSTIIPKYTECGFVPLSVKQLTKEELKDFETTWSKRLVFGRERPLFLMEFKRI